jgi:photosystem II stability/assembly factor-like uncharacterized protein
LRLAKDHARSNRLAQGITLQAGSRTFGSPHFLLTGISIIFSRRRLLAVVFSRIALLLGFLVAMSATSPSQAHDPSAWGGLFRSRDFGANWFPADAGLFIGGALGVAIHPQDPFQLLYGTDARLLRSKNGGRDWIAESAPTMSGAVFAVAFDATGKGAVASTGARIFYSNDLQTWQDALAPGGAAPARAFARSGSSPSRLYLAGARGLFVSEDDGHSWARAGEGILPESAVSTVVLTPGPTERIHAVIGGNIWSGDAATHEWRMHAASLPAGQVQTLAAEAKNAQRLWAVAATQVFKSDDAGMTWRAYGRALPDSGISVRGLAVSDDERILVLATHRGVMRSQDQANTWVQVESTLPVHLESGLLLRDPHDAATLYAGFSLSPYSEMSRRAEQGGSLLAQLDPVSLAGGVAFLLTLLAAGIYSARWLSRHQRGVSATPQISVKAVNGHKK